jgi:8-oxo-dGTP pyrophosphatase MutT (NUDIX family)
MVVGPVLPDEEGGRDRISALMLFDEDDIRARASTRLLRAAPAAASYSDDDMNAHHPMIPKGVTYHPAAVLVPLVARGEGITVLLTQRRENLTKHAGQIAFPGGRIDDTDADPTAAALREAREETGLDPSFVEPLGFLDGYLTVTSYHVTPVVALVRPGFTVAPQEDEVSRVFEVPLSFLMDAANHETHSRDWHGQPRRYYAMPYGDNYIWGATAGMIRNLYQRLYA